MKLTKYICTALVALLIASLTLSSAQETSVVARVSGLENDSLYMALLYQEQELKAAEDSIQQQITNIRANFANVSEDDRVSLSRLILESENALFEARNQVGIVSNQINSIEQQYIISNLSMATSTREVTGNQSSSSSQYSQNGSDLYSNNFFSDNLISGDLSMLVRANSYEGVFEGIEAKYLENHAKLMKLQVEYDSCKNQYTADTISNMFFAIDNLNKAIEDSVSMAMGYIFDTKLYTFSYLFDKMNYSGMLNRLENDLTIMRNEMSERPADAINAVMYNLPLQRSFLLDQEIALAEHLGESSSVDSLRAVKATINKQSYNQPRAEIIERIFIEYVPIKEVSTPFYNASNPIPRLEHFRRGTVYRLFVGSFSSVQAVSVFRNTTPVYHDIESNRHNYYLGGFATLEEAQQAQIQLRNIGFRRPQVVVWVDDVFENLDSTTTTSTSSSSRSSSRSIYRVEILMNDPSQSLSSALQQNISSLASGKELSKQFAADGQSIFVVGTFTSSSEAEALASTLNNTGGCTATVKTIQ